MMHHDEVRALALKISVYKAHKKEPGSLQNFNPLPEMENMWGASYFCAAVLYNSRQERFHTLKMADIEFLRIEFAASSGHDADLDYIFGKGWLREAFTIIAVPSMIKTGAEYASKIKELRNELSFFNWLYNDFAEEIKKISLLELTEHCREYEALNGHTINLESAKNIFWGQKDEVVEIFNTGIGNIVMKDIGSFLFIHEVLQAKKDRHIYIEAVDLAQLHKKHAAFFPSIPAIEHLVKYKAIIPAATGTGFIINFRYSDLKFESVTDKYAAILWDRLIEDNGFENDEERLFFWYTRLIQNEDRIDIKKSFGKDSKDRFLKAALKIVESDRELTNGFPEFIKLYTDKHHARLYELDFAFSIQSDREFFTTSQNLFEIFERIGMLENHYHDNLMMITQEARRPLTQFIWYLVECDEPQDYEYVNRLLEISRNKPYLLWQTCFYIYYWKPEAIAFLTQQDSTAALSFSLIHKFSITTYINNDRGNVFKDSLLETFALIARYCAHSHTTTEQKGKIMFQCLQKVTERKFKNAAGDLSGRKIEKEELIEIAESVRMAFQRVKLPGEIHGPGGKYTLPFYTVLLDELLANTAAYSDFDTYENGTISLPFVQLDLLNYLVKLAACKLPEDKHKGQDAFIMKACKVFSQAYTESINISEIKKRLYPGMTLGTDAPSWISGYGNEVLLDIGMICLHLEHNHLLDDFFSGIKFEFTESDDQYDEFNRFNAQKLRTHLHLLLDAFNNLYNKSSSIDFSDYPVRNTLVKIESKIAHYIRRYCTSDPSSQRFDIFTSGIERGYLSIKKEELLPTIGNVLNRFSKENRQAIIEELIQTEQVVRALKLLEYIINEEERARLLAVATSSTIPKMMQDLDYLDMQFVVQQLSMEPELLEHAQKALEHAEVRVAKFPNAYREDKDYIFIFRTKLLIAYQKGELLDIDAVEDINPRQLTAEKFSASDEKDFYRALIYLKKDEAEKAYRIFEKQLSYASSERPVLALNRFASKLQWADKETDYKKQVKLYKDALEEWNTFESASMNKENWQEIDKNVIYNKLHAFDALGEGQNYDLLYSGLDKEIQLRRDFLSIRVQNLMKRDMQLQAEGIIEEAKRFHSLENGRIPDFISHLFELTRPVETIDYLKEQYRRIFSSSPEQLIKILPDNINKANELPLFLLNEIVSSGNLMLRLINSISTIDYEDKFTDLLLLSLNGRLTNYHWFAETSRGGSAHPKDKNAIDGAAEEKPFNPGEIDFAIFGPNGDRLAICEALILEGKNSIEVQKHNLKIFNYDHARKLFFVIIYYKGKIENFNKNWDSYCSVITEFIQFPIGYGLKRTEVEDIEGISENDSIKVGKTGHENGTDVYHVFMNVNYKVELKEKKVGKVKK